MSGGGLWNSLVKKVDACTVEVNFKGKEAKSDTILIEDAYDETKGTFALYDAEETVKGTVTLKPAKKISHQGIKIELIGIIAITNDREEKHEFTSQCHKHEPDGGELKVDKDIDFEFDCPKQFESYRGLNARVSYYIKVTVVKGLKNILHKQELWVHKPDHTKQKAADNSGKSAYFKEKDFSKGVSMEVGVDDTLHIEFRYDKKLFHLYERVLGQVSFKVVKLDLQAGEVSIVKREYIGVGENQFFESETLQKYEIMDGTPIADEVVPIRIFLNSVPRLTPTYEMVHNLFSVKYYINLVLITGDNKRYFKQQEIIMYRKPGQL
eukprot:TRINITY_DN12566_c0_g1_i1.p1 TRINITY_DN12566_c0_g1~~TRINITY_DN12566_c0_g1_i1.p1  ORF type:complete len:335 (+),score=32.34 TRINITY_DN12566_c0_g1_i1:38-1006(+)